MTIFLLLKKSLKGVVCVITREQVVKLDLKNMEICEVLNLAVLFRVLSFLRLLYY